MNESFVSIGYLVKKLQHAIRIRMDQALENLGLSTSQFAILNAIQEAPGLSSADLARRCFITPQSVNGLIGGLQEKGLIERVPSATHGRVIEIRLSELGASQLRRAKQHVFPIEKEMLRKLSDDERRRLMVVLEVCIEGLADPGA